jgi:hypothetical protein
LYLRLTVLPVFSGIVLAYAAALALALFLCSWLACPLSLHLSVNSHLHVLCS